MAPPFALGLSACAAYCNILCSHRHDARAFNRDGRRPAEKTEQHAHTPCSIEVLKHTLETIQGSADNPHGSAGHKLIVEAQLTGRRPGLEMFDNAAWNWRWPISGLKDL